MVYSVMCVIVYGLTLGLHGPYTEGEYLIRDSGSYILSARREKRYVYMGWHGIKQGNIPVHIYYFDLLTNV